MAKKMLLLLVAALLGVLIGCQKQNVLLDTLSEEDKREISLAVTDMLESEIESNGLLLKAVFVYAYDPGEEYRDNAWYEVKVDVSGTSDMNLLDRAIVAKSVSDISTSDIEKATGKQYEDTILLVNMYGDSGLVIFNGVGGDVTLMEGDELIIFNQTWEALGGESSDFDNVSKPNSVNDTLNDAGTATVVAASDEPIALTISPEPDTATVAEQLADCFKENAGLTFIDIGTASLFGDGIFVKMIYDAPNTVYDFESLVCETANIIISKCEEYKIDYYTITVSIAENGTSLYKWSTDSSRNDPREGTIEDMKYGVYGFNILCDEINSYLAGDDYRSKVSEVLAPCTYEEYLAIETGMTYEEVCGIIGSEGIESATSGNIKIYDWDGDKKYSHVSITFVDNMMHSKVQAGLG